YHSARYYLPWLGRWLSPDPIGLKGGVNPYAYARGNPVKLNDPNGMDPPDPPPDNPGVGVGPFRFSNFQVSDSSHFQVSGNLSVQNLFSSNRSLTINNFSASGTLGVTSDVSLPAFNLTGKGRLRLDLDQLSVSRDLFRVDVSGTSQIDLGPGGLLHLNLNASATGAMDIDRQIFFSNWRQHFENSLSTFRGDATVTGRISAGPAAGFFSLDAHARGGLMGDLSSNGYLRLGSYRLLEAQGSGSFLGESYHLSGRFHGNFPLLTTGSWSLSSAEGFSASGHYVGPQFGPIGLNVGINPLETGERGEYRRPSPGGSIMMFEPGTSVGYTYFRYGSHGSFVFSAGVSFSSSLVEYNQGQPRIPIVSGLPVVGDAVEKALYGRTLSTSMGPYGGVRLGWTF
ncbi:MAG TPA: RHS repeat-associated core domain-containing protein, partial [Pyrinomonadaceae bacterium]|nr:RHS repeat-associated core domain-containing protein [Pyrinomonadaceae bacterium]